MNVGHMTDDDVPALPSGRITGRPSCALAATRQALPNRGRARPYAVSVVRACGYRVRRVSSPPVKYPDWIYFPPRVRPPPWAAVMSEYRYSGGTAKSYRDARDLLQAVYASGRLELPFEGILLFGY